MHVVQLNSPRQSQERRELTSAITRDTRTHLGNHKRDEGLAVKTAYFAAHPRLTKERVLFYSSNCIFYLRCLTAWYDLFQLRSVCMWHHSKALPVHLWFEVKDLPERSSTDDYFGVQVARLQLHQFGEIGGRTDQNATHAHNLKG